MDRNEHARLIRANLKLVESTLRAHHRAVEVLHASLANAVCDCGSDIGLDDDIITAAAPKNPPPDNQ